MDRRDFVKALLSTSAFAAASPLLSRQEKTSAEGTLFVLSDSPQDLLPELLNELGRQGLVSGRTFHLAELHPRAESLSQSLARAGWRLGAARTSDAIVVHSQLKKSLPGSFTYIKSNEILDIRSGKLLSLWEAIHRAPGSSRLLTKVSLRGMRRPESGPGVFVSVFCDGRKVDSLPLRASLKREYETGRGLLEVQVANGLARVARSSCRQGICQDQGDIRFAGERIVCAPSRFSLKVEGAARVDAVIGL